MSNTIPDGYKANAQGHLVPVSTIKPIDLLRDQTVNTIAAKAQNLFKALAEFKSSTFSDLEAFVATSAAQYGVEVGGDKGNLTLHSYDGRFKIVRSVADLIRFDEQLIAAKKLVDDCLSEWTDESRDELRALVNQAFQVNATGSVRTSEVLRLLPWRRCATASRSWAPSLTCASTSASKAPTNTRPSRSTWPRSDPSPTKYSHRSPP
jgi:hypothetical protein